MSSVDSPLVFSSFAADPVMPVWVDPPALAASAAAEAAVAESVGLAAEEEEVGAVPAWWR